MPVQHGIKIAETTTGTRPITIAGASVIGLVGIASDADVATFPLDTAVLITDVQTAVGKAGADGSLAKSLQAIADQCNAQVVVVRVEEGADSAATDTAIIGTTTAEGKFTGLKALLSAQTQLGVKPKILGVPGYDTQAVTTELVTIAQKLKAMAYARAQADIIADAVTYKDNFSDRELMLIWPDFTGFAGDAVARALGTRARIDSEAGWNRSLSNYAVNGVTGISADVHWDMGGENTDAATLNDAAITTLIRNDGFRFWGNRTCSDDPLYVFEVATRTNYVLQETIAQGLTWAMDKPITAPLVKDILETINAAFRSLTNQGLIIGATAWYNAALNSQVNLAGGKLAISYDFTPCAPLESLTVNTTITDTYYASLSSQLAA
jgi:phage tail sheath protein FI